MTMESFCYQCEQTVGGGCTTTGNCGKDPRTSVLQDLVMRACTGIAAYAHRAAELGVEDPSVGRALLAGLFTTVTNVNFDPERLRALLDQLGTVRDTAVQLYGEACRKKGREPEVLGGAAAWRPSGDSDALTVEAPLASIRRRIDAEGADLAGLKELVIYGMKGAAAYAEHARKLGKEDPAVYRFFFRVLDLTSRPDATAEQLLGAALECGKVNLDVMGLLDAAHTGAYGHPSPTAVRVTPVAGKAILVSGHDLEDLALLLQQTEGKGINVYTHGEMLPAHGYPELRRYKHLVGNYGGAWQDQRQELDAFPGAILMTTNCIQEPRASYKARIFTSGLVAWPGVTHVGKEDFSPVIAAALAAPGFDADAPAQHITVGFGHHAVLSVADKVIAGVKSGAIRHFFLIGGCDGAKSGRNYYTEFAQAAPKDTVILTLACGKYRFNKLDFGDIGGIPRLLDIGQCNDAYSAIQIAVALAGAFGTDVNSLPLSMVLSWYEQKAVAVLLTLLHLGIKNIHLGPSLPAFVTPAVLKILVDKFQIKAIGNVADDLRACLERAA